MTIRHLTVFITVVDSGCSVTKASEILHVAQPSVSQTIAELEAQYAVKLFNRLNRRLYLTPEGEKLAGYARRLTGSFTELDDMMKNASGTMPLRVGASFTTGTVVLPELLRKNAGLAAVVSVCNTSDIERMLLAGRLDVAVVEGAVESADIIQVPLVHDDLVFAAAPDYAPDSSPVFILREQGSGTRQLSDAMLTVWAEKTNLKPVVWEISNTQTICALAAAGQGTTIISRRLIQRELASGILADRTPGDETLKTLGRRTFRLVYHKDKYLDQRMMRFIDSTSAVRQL
jgi:Transcriptional regulator